ncbi:hypothetical protein [Streptomyces clavuligerus]|uniref:Uncharacterized protein n=1 Tax=Streptomyces clavuligerus TaxID=1901 RepID=B5GZM4_STRCL|nr:hypothetical protein [Streptomyces clavuligerus]EDY51770.1 hypothetical protein SSCG_04841 [Streptomyces clavuligerus]EFG03878.1 Hypothetical protein SCLAV_p0388 [Streptomyces clavuligerus]QCS09836.1 hypothetical protein CRV15_29980 [Streptomyces clavuligerus]QPJ98122.1 hypothetical protein GE265_34450 [Streptomyces clavuligerus]WDN56541.1 hypothetical protein LL058_32450 [Streptomyces clavuligerus]
MGYVPVKIVTPEEEARERRAFLHVVLTSAGIGLQGGGTVFLSMSLGDGRSGRAALAVFCIVLGAWGMTYVRSRRSRRPFRKSTFVASVLLAIVLGAAIS